MKQVVYLLVLVVTKFLETKQAVQLQSEPGPQIHEQMEDILGYQILEAMEDILGILLDYKRKWTLTIVLSLIQ
jgi:hypothetical protein